MDNREDPGQYYPGGSVVPARPEPAAHPVESVNGHAGNVVLDASDVGALPDTTAIPTADTVSGWGFLRKTWANLTSAFASIVHTHTKSNITDFAHGHSQSDVTGLTTALSGKQAELVSGTNIKTVNGQSLLGSGDIEVEAGGGVSSVNDKTGDVDIVFSAGNTSVTYTSATIPLSPDVSLVTVGTIAFGQVKPTLSISGEGDVEATVPTPSSPAAYEVKVPVPDLSSYVKAEDVPEVVAPSATAAEDAAASAKATGEALATLSASVPTAVSQLTDAGDYLKKSGGTMTGALTVEGVSEKAVVSDGEFSIVTADDANVLKINGGNFVRYSGSSENTISLPNASGTIALTSDIKTKTSQLTNDSGFVTASDIPMPTRVKNAADTERIDGSGNIYPVVNQYDGGTWTAVGTLSGTGTINLTFTNCTKVGNNYQWTNPDDSSMKLWVEPNGVLYWYYVRGGYRGISTGATNPNPFNGYSFGTRTDSTVTLKHTNTNRTPTEQEANAKLAREYPIKSLTVTGSDATALDSTINTITPTATTTIAPPTAKTIGARDWIVVVTQGATAYGVTFSGSFVAESGFSWPTMEASKTYVFSFTEVSSNKFLASVKEVANV